MHVSPVRSILASASVSAVCAVMLLAGCKDDAQQTWPTQAPPQARLADTPVPQTDETVTYPAAGEEQPVAPEQAQPVPHESKGFRVVVTASFSELPEGARIIAPSPRDRRYQKVSKSEHSGAAGAVMPADDNENLFFVSDPISGPTATYTGSFEVVRRVGSPGTLQAAQGQDFDGNAPPVGDVSTDAGVVAAAQALGAEKKQAYDELQAVMDAAIAIKPDAAGPATAAEAIAQKKANTLGLARATVELLRLRGVPALVVQGIELGAVPSTVETTHAWVDANLPQLGWVPLDPEKRQGIDEVASDARFRGMLPIDRIDLAYGDSTVLPADGTFPETTLTGDLAAPMAVKDGARVGKVTWSAKVEVLPEAAPE
ncbi:MAG: transglutaminase domain-containing protein [Deltaproteobacteria bacterium]|nr:transglutaminase domain-containing protein [Deltaproteobacteria bacterium]MCB9785757.1 transglutaminase domain-containing protein [Deltaproteobacteria bacterium]